MNAVSRQGFRFTRRAERNQQDNHMRNQEARLAQARVGLQVSAQQLCEQVQGVQGKPRQSARSRQ
jgi:hypothetical protein